jgi:hypothetical protein
VRRVLIRCQETVEFDKLGVVYVGTVKITFDRILRSNRRIKNCFFDLSGNDEILILLIVFPGENQRFT